MKKTNAVKINQPKNPPNEAIEAEVLSLLEGEKARFTATILTLQKIIHDIKFTQLERLGDPSTWDAKQVISMDVTLKFWSIDGVVRLLGLDPKCKDVESIFNEASNFSITIENLSKLFLQTRDADTVIALACIAVDGKAVSDELKKREEARDGLSVATGALCEDPHNEEKMDALCDQAIKMARVWFKNKRLLRPLYLKTAARYRGGAYSIASKNDRNILRERAPIIQAVLGHYQNLQNAIKADDLRSIPSSIISAFRPSLPVWEREGPRAFLELLHETLKRDLPALDGSLQGGAGKYIDLKKGEYRRAEKISAHEVKPKEIENNEEGEKSDLYPTLTGFKDLDTVTQEAIGRREIIDPHIEAMERRHMESVIDEACKYEKGRARPLAEVFKMTILEGWTAKDACLKADLNFKFYARSRVRVMERIERYLKEFRDL